jgi:putative ubiquitin-RnfH superfamily antitoxin RatB of RatAB toxin-antitoxin module
MSCAERGQLRVSVVYLRPGLRFDRTLCLAPPATIGAAIEASGVRQQVPELASAPLEVGVFSERRTLTDCLRDGDRVEIYRPLTIDPKEARRIRAAVRRRRRSGGAAAG